MPGRIAIAGSLLDLRAKNDCLSFEADLNQRIAASDIGESACFYWTTLQDRHVLPLTATGSLKERLSTTNRQQRFDAIVLLHDLDGGNRGMIRDLALQASVPVEEPPASVRTSVNLIDWLLDRLEAGMAGDVWCLGPHGMALVIVLCVMIKDKAWSSTGHGHGTFFVDSPKLRNEVSGYIGSLRIKRVESIIGDVITAIQGQKRANQEQLIVRGGTPERFMLNSHKRKEICGSIRSRDIAQLGTWISNWIHRKDNVHTRQNIFKSRQQVFTYPKLVNILHTVDPSVAQRANADPT